MEALKSADLQLDIKEEPTSKNIIRFAQLVLERGISLETVNEAGRKMLSVKQQSEKRESILFPRTIRTVSVEVFQEFEGNEVTTKFSYPFGTTARQRIDISTSLFIHGQPARYTRSDMMSLDNPDLQLMCQEDQSTHSGPFTEAQLREITRSAYKIAFKALAKKS